jgi:hypothetical protein
MTDQLGYCYDLDLIINIDIIYNTHFGINWLTWLINNHLSKKTKMKQKNKIRKKN